MRTLLAVAAAAVVLAVTTPARAATVTVAVDSMTFSPGVVSVGLGGTVVWNFAELHTSTSDNGFWDSGTKGAGDSYARVFSSAGTFGYHCALHSSMTGKVTVPLRATASAGGYRLRWSTTAARTGRAFDVQYRKSTSSKWKPWRTNTAAATGMFKPAAAPYVVRARTSNLTKGTESGWSPAKKLTVR